jgi:hypothetical protein
MDKRNVTDLGQKIKEYLELLPVGLMLGDDTKESFTTHRKMSEACLLDFLRWLKDPEKYEP